MGADNAIDNFFGAMDNLNAHLEICERCRKNPFDLCKDGIKLLFRANEEALQIIAKGDCDER